MPLVLLVCLTKASSCESKQRRRKEEIMCQASFLFDDQPHIKFSFQLPYGSLRPAGRLSQNPSSCSSFSL